MLVLLPPSEGKTAPARGAPVRLDALAFPELTPVRERIAAALRDLALGPEAPALAALGLSAGRGDELRRNSAILHAPAAKASAVYTGVLYEHLRLAALPAAARRRVLIASALWGVVRAGDRIPAYKLPIGAKLPGLGPLAALWRPPLRAVLPDRGLVVDLRSGAYATAWTPRHADLLIVRAFTAEGAAVSHMVKATRGRVARVLLEATRPPRTPEQAAALVAASGLQVELSGVAGRRSLDVTARNVGVGWLAPAH